MSFLSAAERLPAAGPAASSAAWRFTLPASSPCFAGHFAGDPVLPGVAHIAVALEACAGLHARLPDLAAVEDLRFLQPVRPDVACEVSVTVSSANAARFDIRCGGVASSRGVLVFSAPWAMAS